MPNAESENCLFCEIISGAKKAHKVYEDDFVFAIKDIAPKAPTHILFFPKEHFASLSHVPMDRIDLMTHLFSAIKNVTKQLGVDSDGYRIAINTGKKGGQSVFHLHLHLLAGKSMGDDFA